MFLQLQLPSYQTDEKKQPNWPELNNKSDLHHLRKVYFFFFFLINHDAFNILHTSVKPSFHSNWVHLCEEGHTDLQVLWQVVEQNDLQQQLLSSDNVGRKIQGKEEILEHRELREDFMETSLCTVSSGRRQHLQLYRHQLRIHLSGQKKRKNSAMRRFLLKMCHTGSHSSGVNTSAGLSTMPRPRFSDMTKAVAVQVVMLSGTVRCISSESELLWKKDAQTCFFNVKRRSKHDFKKLPKYQVCFLLQMKSNLSYS